MTVTQNTVKSLDISDKIVKWRKNNECEKHAIFAKKTPEDFF